MSAEKTPLFGKTLVEIEAITNELRLPRFRTRQILEWLYKHHAQSIDDMTNLSKDIRRALGAGYTLGRKAPKHVAVSKDGTKKYLFETVGGKYIETALIPDKDRATICLSTQVGCRRLCSFCRTGQQGLEAQLSATDILNQYASCPERDEITNIVYMGMGEPLDNLEEVMKSLEIFTADYGYAKSPTRLTVSTVGIIPALKVFLEESRCNLAISLHSPFEEERLRLMPVQKQYPIAEVIDLLRNYDFSGQRRLTFEYILFEGINDTLRHADALVQLIKGLPARINLIAFNVFSDAIYRAPQMPIIEAFQNRLKENGIIAMLRKSRGQDIAAACGLLSTSVID